MLLDSFCMGYFRPLNEKQTSLLEDFKTVRMIKGNPKRITILRALAKTRKHTHTIYPPGWKLE